MLVLFNASAYCQNEKQPAKEKAASAVDRSISSPLVKETEENQIDGEADGAQLLLLNTKIEKLLKKKDDSALTYITPIAVAFFAGFLALLQVKSNTISTSRISWIENLRVSLSQFIGEGLIMNFHFVKARDLTLEGKEEEGLNLYEETVPQTLKMAGLSYKIRLYLNSTETNHIELENLLRKFEKLVVGNIDDVGKSEELYKVTEELISTAKGVLKGTWDDAKSIKISDLVRFKY